MTDIVLPTGTPAAFTKSTWCAAFQTTVAERADDVALRTRGDATRITWRDYGARVRRIAGGLAAHGVRSGDTVAILLLNRPEFNLVDVAAIHLGAVPFSIYVTSTAEQIRYRERMARAVVAKLLDRGLLTSGSHRAPLRLGFPIEAAERWFPRLFPGAGLY